MSFNTKFNPILWNNSLENTVVFLRLPNPYPECKSNNSISRFYYCFVLHLSLTQAHMLTLKNIHLNNFSARHIFNTLPLSLS